MLRHASERPSQTLDLVEPPLPIRAEARGDLPLLAHAHLDLAWLWTFAEGRRKAQRTFANALQAARLDSSYVFIQSQPALYEDVERDDPGLFTQIVRAVASRAIDPSVGALWVESDCNIPSGESLLRQCALGTRYVQERFGIAAEIAWLPDSFGFPNSLPQLLAHAGIRFFATTKLQWNDTTRWPHPQFVWRGPDGSSVIAAVIDSYEGEPTSKRIARARERREPLVLGYGDGGGGPNEAIVRDAARVGRWTSASGWFERLGLRADALPRVNGELYLQTHRGVFTTHHDVKARRFALEAALDEAEELCAWCQAVRAAPPLWKPLAAELRSAWPIFLRGDFHDVVSGTSIGEVYRELDEAYSVAEQICARVRGAALAILPRGSLQREAEAEVPPRFDEGTYVFENRFVQARVRRDGTVVELQRPGEPNVVTGANVLRAYADVPREWEAWNLDRGYEKRPVRVRVQGSEVEDDALVVRFSVRESTVVLRIALRANDPYLRVDGAVLWETRRTILRLENWLAVEARNATCGTPHATLDRPVEPSSDEERAKFEFPAQRFARIDGPRGGFALLATDNYGWSLRSLRKGGVRLGLSLLRAPRWPDPDADRGEHRLAYAFLPAGGELGIGALERIWREYAYPSRVRLFTCDDPAVLVVAVKPADDDDGVVVRVRECDGAARRLRLRCGGRPREVESCDARERRREREAALDDGAVVASLEPYELRSFRVRF